MAVLTGDTWPECDLVEYSFGSQGRPRLDLIDIESDGESGAESGAES